MEIPPIRDPVSGKYNVDFWTPVHFSWDYVGGVPHEVIHPCVKPGMLVYSAEQKELCQYEKYFAIRRAWVEADQPVMLTEILYGTRINVMHQGMIWQTTFPKFFAMLSDIYPDKYPDRLPKSHT